MISRDCHIATWPGVALTKTGQSAFHDTCPGVCQTDTGTIEWCDCDCHPLLRPVKPPIETLPSRIPPAVSVSAPDPVAPDQDRVVPSRAATGRCEHCGAPTGGRFAPGHDAKLKSQLWKGACGGSWKDWAELRLRGWATNKMEISLDFAILARGDDFAKRRGQDFVDQRSAWRQVHGDGN